MNVVKGLSECASLPPRSVVTIGNFDGLHRGHQQILATARQRASSADVPLTVITFEPHPLVILMPSKAPQRLSSLDQKLALLEAHGVDCVMVLESTPDLLSLEPETFVRDVISARIHPTHIVEGADFRFGHNRAGDLATLRKMAEPFGYQVDEVPPVLQTLENGTEARVSSSMIRSLIAEGRVASASEALGRAFAVEGVVQQGALRGKSLGFPTANLAVTEQMIPGDGVYAGDTVVDDRRWLCAISIGSTPTFDGHARQLEAHLLDYDGSLYGRRLTVAFRRRIRGQHRFDSRDALVEQIQRDVAEVRQMNEHPAPSSQASG